MSDNDNVVPMQSRRRIQNASHLSLRRELRGNVFTKDMFAWNSFARELVLLRPIPRPNLDYDTSFKPRLLEDSDLTALIEHFESRGFKKLGVGMVRDVVALEAKTNSFSPPADYFKALIWDCEPRMSRFFIDYAGVEFEGEDDEEKARFQSYVEAVTRAFFISVIARVMQPGAKVDSTVVLEGAQGIRKSSLLAVLAIQEAWFSDSMPHDLGSKDAREHLPGKLVIELAELSQLRRSEMETIKSFLTCRFDKYRPSYGRSNISWPRQNVFVGTTNSSEYLQDSSGNRRFWPLRTTSIRVEEAAAIIKQVYAEAYAAWDSGEQWWLDPATEEIAHMVQEARVWTDSWHDQVEVFVRDEDRLHLGERWVTVADALAAINIPNSQRDRSAEMRVTAILKQLGGVRRYRTVGKRRQWAYWFRQ